MNLDQSKYLMVPLKCVVKNSHVVLVYLSASKSDTVYYHMKGLTQYSRLYTVEYTKCQRRILTWLLEWLS